METDLWAHIMCVTARNRVRVPLLCKQVTVGIDVVKEQFLKKPDVTGVRTIQPEFTFEPKEESTPGAAEIPTNFHPKSFNTCIVGGADRRYSAIPCIGG